MQNFSDSTNFFNSLMPKPEALLESGDLFTILKGLAAVIFIGLLVGLEREYSRRKDERIFAGIRTFPLIGIYGFSSALIASITELWIYVIFFLGFAMLSVAAYYTSAKEGRIGGTSEISGFLVFILGSLVYWGYMLLPVIIAIIITMFLSLKIQLHSFVGKVSAADIYATLKLAIITLIILPLLPDKTFGPYDVLNPRLIWYMVIFVSGISFVGYVLIKVLGKDRGIIITGLLGGLISSTAVTYSLSKKSKQETTLSNNFGIGIIIATSIMFIRVLIIISVLNFELIGSVLLPLLVFTVVGIITSFILQKRTQAEPASDIEIRNPLELRSAFLFGAVFGITIFLTKAAQVYFGDQGIFAASALAGFSSVDAIVISLAKLAEVSIQSNVVVKAILFALLANTVVKMFITSLWGSIEIRKIVWKGLSVLLIFQMIYLFYISIFN